MLPLVRIPRKWHKDTNKSLNILVYYCFTVTKECLQREQTPFHTGLLLSRILKSKSSPYPKPVDLKEILMHCRVEFNSVSWLYVINIHIQKQFIRNGVGRNCFMLRYWA